MPGPIAVCANQAWNLVNFRAGLIRALIARGFRVVAIAPPDAEMERRLADMGCAFEPVAIDSAGLSPLRDFATFLAFRRAIARHRPAAWLSWTIKPNVYGSLAARLAGVPAFPNVSGLGTAFIRKNLLTQIVTRLYTAGFARAHRVFFQNSDDRDLFVSLGMVRAEQAALLPGSGIDAAHWAPANDQRPGPNHFLMIARVVADKGVREYAEAAKRVRVRFPKARFALMGPLDVANRTAIPREEVMGWQEEGAIEYMAPSDDVRSAVNAADWIVLPSYREGLSRVLLEAAAMARPIVTTDVPGCRDVVSNGVNGFLCEARDAASLAAALERAAACDDAQWRAMGQAGRARVQAEFSQERVTGLYLEALESAGISPSDAE
ncbi:glycosyltransferase family 4 protein [Novosphingobium sp. MW5]|nr:glycosyltransferase family 4 protein [Novosphingobium sp. MW5]